MKEKIDTYLVSVTILEGRHYAWPSMDSFVHVRVGNHKNCTKIQKNTDCPYYNEYFVFEFKTDLQSLIDKSITLTVIRPRTCWRKRKILGYCTLDLATIWSQPEHLFFQKWAIISSNTPQFVGPRGYLKVTLCILTKGELTKIPLTKPRINDEIEGNLLLPEGMTLERQRALFIFKVYKGEDIAKFKTTTYEISKKPQFRSKNMPNSTIEITFAGITVTTSVQKNTGKPVWNETLTIAELFPPLCQRVKIVLKTTNTSFKAVKYFNLYSIANDQEHGFLPTFGPTYVHFYSDDKFGSAFVGKVLMSLYTQLQHDYLTQTKSAIKKPIMPINENTLYKFEPVLLFGAILRVNAVDKRFSKKPMRFEISIGNPLLYNVTGSEGDGTPLNVTSSFIPKPANETYWYLDFADKVPCFSFQNSFPDLRKRFYNANMIEKLSTDFKSRLDDIEPLFEFERLQIPSDIIESRLIDALDYLAIGCRKYVDMVEPTINNYITELDREKLKLCIREMKDIENMAKTVYSTRTKKKSFRKAQKLFQRLALLIDHPQDCWPKIIIQMVYNNRRVATLSVKTETVTFSMIDEEAGKFCGKIQHLFFQTPLKLISQHKTSTACVMDIILWIGLKRHMDFCFHSIPECFKFPCADIGLPTIPRYMINPEKHIFQCRAHIYQGNFKFGMDSSGLADLFARIIFNKCSGRTEIIKAVLNPLWNETITFTNIIMYGSKDYLKLHTPNAIVEVIDRDQKFQNDFLGRTLIKPAVKLKEDPYTQPNYPPKLTWHSIIKDNIIAGKVLACIELLEMSSLDEVIKSDSKQEVVSIPDDIRPKLTGYKIDVLFWGLRHLKKLYRIPITKPKITLDCTMATLASEVLTRNELNFSVYQKELIVNLPQEEEYIPSLSFKLFDNRSFGRFTYVGNHITSMQRFLRYPLTKEERELKLKQSSHKSYDSMDSQVPSIREETPLEPKNMSTVIAEAKFKVENEVTGCCALCKRICKKKKRKSGEKESKKESKKEIKKEFFSIKNETEQEVFDEDDYVDWWNKYYLSIQSLSASQEKITEEMCSLSKSFRLKIYNDELEHQPEFDGLQDMLVPFTIIRGEKTGDDEVDQKNIMGIFKGNVRVYPWPPHKNAQYVTPTGLPIKKGYFQDYPLNESISYLARVYCVRGIKLRPKDAGGKTDPFLVAFMGNQHYNDSKNYIPKQVNPIFGKCFEFSGTFPLDTVVTIQVWDWDRNTKHDFIGETKIDLENRYYTKHRAQCGLSYEYTEVGYTPWRDMETPCEILESLCKKANISQPKYFDTYVLINNLIFAPTVEENEQPKAFYNKQELALTVLHRWYEIPVVGCRLIPEHVETRSLYNPRNPGLEQGKLQLWVDIFPCSDLPPPNAVIITPQVPKKYELRIIIWNTEDIVLEEDDFFVGEKKSDIYVKGWLTGADEAQTTDVHYRSLSGEGNFNWRFVFPFSYLKTEHKIVVVKKERIFDRTPSEKKIPCLLKLQVWDNDSFSPDDFLGSLTLDLRRMPRGARSSDKCTLKLLEANAPQINMFRLKRIRGWWPFRGMDKQTNEYILAGKLDAEFHLLTSEEAEANPAGLGRKEPNPLPNPNGLLEKVLRHRKSFKSLITNTLSNISSIRTVTWWNSTNIKSYFK